MFTKTLSHLSRYKKIGSMALLSVLSAISFHLAVSMRESVLLSLTQGASFVPFIKTYLTLPFTFIIGAFYLLLQRRLGTVKTYTIINLGLLSYFVLFSLVLNPYHHAITPSHEHILIYKSYFPGLRFFLGIIEYWPCALFHMIAEIWSIYVFIILFWQVANETFTHQEACQYYPIISTLIGIGTTLSAYPIARLGLSANPSVAFLSILVPISVTMNAIVYFIDHEWGLEQSAPPQTKSDHIKSLSLSQKILKLLDNSLSPQVLCLSICLFSFNFLVCLFETCFWSRVSSFYSSQQDLLSFYSSFTLLKGSLSLLTGFINIYLLKRIGWKAVLNITPIVCVAAIHLFLFYHFPQSAFNLFFSQNILPQMPTLITWFFALCLGLSYASKFSFFDPTKEIIISKLPSEERRFSKVLADGLSGRAGKIIGSAVQSMLLSVSAAESILDLTPLVFIFSFFASVIFINSIFQLQNESTVASSNQPMRPIEES